MIIGGQATLLYGEPRLTRDIDITLGVNTDRLNEIITIIKKLRLKIIPDDVENFVNGTFVLPVIGSKGIRIDFIFSFTEYELQAIDRSNKIRAGGIYINYASVEDLIIHKIFAGRQMDLEDVRVILKKQNVDDLYIMNMKWLKEFEESLDKRFIDTYTLIQNEVKKNK